MVALDAELELAAVRLGLGRRRLRRFLEMPLLGILLKGHAALLQN
jgi:hypothetical protein